MTLDAVVGVLVVALSVRGAFAGGGAADCTNGDCKYQSSALLQRAKFDESVQLVDALEDEVGHSGAHQTHQHRATVLVERDLSQLARLHYKNYDPKKGVDENIKEAFDHFLDTTGLGDELDDEERQLYWNHFKEDIALRLKHEHDHDRVIADPEKHEPRAWHADLAKALEEEKPLVTNKLVEVINKANLGYTATDKKWVRQLAKHDWISKMGLQRHDGPTSSGPEAASLLQSQGMAIPDSFESAEKWPACSEVILRAHDQAHCGSCWAFAALSPLDSRLCIKTNASWSGPRAMFSRGHITSCTYSADRDGCSGGWPSDAYKLFKYGDGGGGGLTGGTEGCSPYFGHGSGTEHFQQSDPAPPCPSMCASSYKLRGIADDRFKFPSMAYQDLNRERHPNMLTLAKESMMSGGPIPFALATPGAFMSYSSGVYDADCTAGPSHGSAAVGWGPGYISAMNSWGPDWGESGGFRITECGVTDFVVFDFSVGNDAPNPLLAELGPTPAPTRGPPTPAPTESDHPWEVTFGPCTRDSAGCIMSGNYPSPYSANEECQFTIHWQVPIEVVDFSTEGGSDYFVVDDMWYSGHAGRSIHGKNATKLSWMADNSGSASGWKLCPRASGGGNDGTAPAPAPASHGLCEHANIMPFSYVLGSGSGYTLDGCVQLCQSRAACKAFFRPSSAPATHPSTCYFSKDYIVTQSVAYPGWMTVQVEGCPHAAPAPGPAPGPAPAPAPAPDPTSRPTGRPTSIPTYLPSSVPSTAPTSVPTSSSTTSAPRQDVAQNIVSSCSFEKDIGCNVWSNVADDQSDQFDWTRGSGSTPSAGTGPQAAGDGSYYLFIEASSPRRQGDTAVLKAAGLALQGSGQLKFMYSMNGGYVGSLNVFADGENVWSKKGDQGADWHNAVVDISSSSSGMLELRFEGVRWGWSGDIAIDKIVLESRAAE